MSQPPFLSGTPALKPWEGVKAIQPHLKAAAKIALNYKGQRTPALRAEVFDILGALSPSVAVEADGIRYYVSTRDLGLGRVVFAHGSYEQDIMGYTVDIAYRHARANRRVKDMTFIDIGANIGTSSLPALLEFGAGRVIAFEPDLENFKLLRCNLIMNDVDHRARLYNVALSYCSGDGLLERAEDSWGDHRIRVRDDVPDGSFRESLRSTGTVRVARFDDVVRDEALDLAEVGLAWMDVQGHEGHVLAGAESLLESDIPIAIEYWPYGLRRVDGLDLLHGLIARNFSRVVDVRASMVAGRLIDLPANSVPELVGRYEHESYTDLLLIT